jgi:hypothetical protein
MVGCLTAVGLVLRVVTLPPVPYPPKKLQGGGRGVGESQDLARSRVIAQKISKSLEVTKQDTPKRHTRASRR